jgi:rfaE bifunctional protein kinase chain/domain
MISENLFEKIRQLKVAVIGDVMLDTYWWGNADRISPEAPVPVVAVERTEHRVGGAANVALNALALANSVTVMSVVGDDSEGNLLLQELNNKGIGTRGIFKSKQRITTNKTRVISRNQQMIRLDRETQADLNPEDERAFIQLIRDVLDAEHPDIVILEDYNKGVLTTSVIEKALQLCKERNLLSAVDPKKKNFFSYKGADLFKPNLKEVKEALHIDQLHTNLAGLQEVHDRLHKELHHSMSLITLSEKGIFCQPKAGKPLILPSHRRTIADVSGAGDTVIAVASLVYAATKDPLLMTAIANLAGGIVCEEVGTVPIQREKLIEESMRLKSLI